jgi:hypothetical protein
MSSFPVANMTWALLRNTYITDDHGNVPFVVWVTIPYVFPLSWRIINMTIRHTFNMRNTMGATNGAGFVNPLQCIRAHVAQYLVFSVMFCGLLFLFCLRSHWPYRLSVDVRFFITFWFLQTFYNLLVSSVFL